jgi:hypothetical protein
MMAEIGFAKANLKSSVNDIFVYSNGISYQSIYRQPNYFQARNIGIGAKLFWIGVSIID